jgi:molybdate transport system ATP-binding protein
LSSAPRLRARLVARVGPLRLDVEFETGDGPLVVIGPNGAGKTSLLALLIGVLEPEHARIEIGGDVLVDTAAGLALPVEQRRFGYVPQDYALFPHLSVQGNVAFAVRSARGGPDAARVGASLRDLGIAELAQRLPQTLSGGEKQRVALARALSVEPRALLLDEPLAALDVHARREVRGFLATTLRTLALPTLVVTHDPVDARLLGERVLVLELGQVTQLGSWDELVASPASRFVAEFVAAAA